MGQALRGAEPELESFENLLRTDEYDVFKIDQGQLAWVSFLDGMQRVLLFTNQPLLAQQLAKTTGRLKIKYSRA